MTQLSVREAATRVGITRQTLFKYIRQGKLSATIGKNGQKQVDISELLRVFGELQETPETTDYSRSNRQLSPNTTATATTTALQMEVEKLKTHLEFKAAELALAKERIDELKAREQQTKEREREAIDERNRLIGVIEQQNRLLAAPAPVKAVPAKRSTPVKRKAVQTTLVAPASKTKTTSAKLKTSKSAVLSKPTPAKKKSLTVKKTATTTIGSKKKA